MGDQFTADVFNVKSRGGADVPAKYLQDGMGNFIIDQSTGRPYIVPRDYDPRKTIADYSGFRQYAIDTGNDPLPHVMGALYRGFTAAFPGGKDDLQRFYNGRPVTSVDGFVPSFTAAGSYNYGLAAAAAGIPDFMVKPASGLQNLKSRWKSENVKTGGEFFNAPANVPHIEAGFAAHGQELFGTVPPNPNPWQRSNPTPPSADPRLPMDTDQWWKYTTQTPENSLGRLNSSAENGSPLTTAPESLWRNTLAQAQYQPTPQQRLAAQQAQFNANWGQGNAPASQSQWNAPDGANNPNNAAGNLGWNGSTASSAPGSLWYNTLAQAQIPPTPDERQASLQACFNNDFQQVAPGGMGNPWSGSMSGNGPVWEASTFSANGPVSSAASGYTVGNTPSIAPSSAMPESEVENSPNR